MGSTGTLSDTLKTQFKIYLARICNRTGLRALPSLLTGVIEVFTLRSLTVKAFAQGEQKPLFLHLQALKTSRGLWILYSLSDSSESQGEPRKLSVMWLRFTDKDICGWKCRLCCRGRLRVVTFGNSRSTSGRRRKSSCVVLFVRCSG